MSLQVLRKFFYERGSLIDLFRDKNKIDTLLQSVVFQDELTSNIKTITDSITTTNTNVTNLSSSLNKSLFDSFINVLNITTTETVLFTYTISANTLVNNGDTIRASYSFNITNDAITKRLKLYFGTTVIYDSAAMTSTDVGTVSIEVMLIKASSTTIRFVVNCFVTNLTGGLSSVVSSLGTLDFTITNLLKVTGTAGAGGIGGEITTNFSKGELLLKSV